MAINMESCCFSFRKSNSFSSKWYWPRYFCSLFLFSHQQIYFCENCLTDIIDPIKDQVSSSDYSEEEDPLLYQSTKTGRGPMKENWLEQYRVDKPPSDVMCAYKLIKVEFRYWGMQVNVVKEGFLCFVAFRGCFKFVFFYLKRST